VLKIQRFSQSKKFSHTYINIYQSLQILEEKKKSKFKGLSIFRLNLNQNIPSSNKSKIQRSRIVYGDIFSGDFD